MAEIFDTLRDLAGSPRSPLTGIGLPTDGGSDRESARSAVLARCSDPGFASTALDLLESRDDALEELVATDSDVALRLVADDPARARHLLAAASTPHDRHARVPVIPLVRFWREALRSPLADQIWTRQRATAGYVLAALPHVHGVADAVDRSRAALIERGLVVTLRVDAARAATLLDDEPLRSMADFWGDVRRGAASDPLGRAGVRAQLVRFGTDHPELWAESLPLILRDHRDLHGLDRDLSVRLALRHTVVRDELVDLARRRDAAGDRARGVMALVGDTEHEDLGAWAASLASRWADRSRRFPHPLEMPAHTWLADLPTEDALAQACRRAQDAFGEVVREQGATEEEHLVGRLVDRLETAWDAACIRLAVLGAPTDPRPVVALSQRPVPKAEEALISADIGLLVEVDVPDHLRTTFGELVQVKKSTRLGATPTVTEGWRIDVDQLEGLLGHSPTACYWLLLGDGKVVCVPARLLQAHGTATGRMAQGTFTVSYTEIRHASIPLETFLRDLLVGMWVGSAADELVSIARGDSATTRPRALLRIRASLEQDAG